VVTADIGVDAAGRVVMNGPKGSPDWDRIDWCDQQRRVQRLRQRIFTASAAGDLKRVRNLQKLMLRSRANTLVSVRCVTERNAGRLTPGIDGRVVTTGPQRSALAAELHSRVGTGHALAVRRVYVPKKDGKRRPLGIPVIADRAQQHRVRNALEPEWEARLDRKQYGFRPGRGCHDAIQMIHSVLAPRNAKRDWVIDADLKAAFDRIDHTFLLEQIGMFPGRDQIAEWLKAGVVDRGRWAPTEEGTPQGGCISPLLLNIALQGMEHAAGVEYGSQGYVKPGRPTVVTYADDFVVLCHSREQAEQVYDRLSVWLAERGLSFNKGKTRITKVTDGFDFLSFNIRRYNKMGGTKVLTRPSRDAMKRMRRRIADELRALRGACPVEVIRVMNPIIRGQANYHRIGASSKSFAALDTHLWQHLQKWVLRRHPRKPRTWVMGRYFGPFNPARRDKWVFGDRQTGAYLHRYAWTKIVRHVPVTGTNSPDDPALTQYWAERRRKRKPPQVAESWQRDLRLQHGLCPLCREPLLFADHVPDSPSQWESWYAGIRKAIGHRAITSHNGRTTHRLIHTHCARRHLDDVRHKPAPADADSPTEAA
jgi:RNA-directed DNA polymerase